MSAVPSEFAARVLSIATSMNIIYFPCFAWRGVQIAVATTTHRLVAIVSNDMASYLRLIAVVDRGELAARKSTVLD